LFAEDQRAQLLAPFGVREEGLDEVVVFGVGEGHEAIVADGRSRRGARTRRTPPADGRLAVRIPWKPFAGRRQGPARESPARPAAQPLPQIGARLADQPDAGTSSPVMVSKVRGRRGRL